MKKNSHEQWPEIIFGSQESRLSQAIRRAVLKGQLRKIAPRLYTSNLKDSPATIITRNCFYILGELYPNAVISHRSALEGGISKEGVIFLTYKYSKKISLPGLTIRLLKGHGAQPDDTPFMGKLFISSRARAFLENLEPSREKETIKKTVSRETLEKMLDKIARIYGEKELNRLRDDARELANKLDLQKEELIFQKMIGAFLGSQSTTILQSEPAKARASGMPYDTARLELFANLFAVLQKEIFPLRDEQTTSVQGLHYLAFFEAYFSNYIEGTEFEVEEAADIVFHHKLTNRPLDAHDVTATFQIVGNTNEMNIVPNTPKELLSILKKRHHILMETREDKQPGQLKTISNRVGNLIFVAPELVEGTLTKTFSLYENLESGIARAIFIMFVITEIHPFIDGNGRIARMMMNAELVHAKQSRIIIPTVYREDYLLALRNLSRTGDTDAYIRMLLRAQAFTASIDFSDYEKALQQLRETNAFMQPFEGKLKF
ncbi:MAG: Fic family protein [Gammaproteobacteria bacterium]